jgi:hypothetical protein
MSETWYAEDVEWLYLCVKDELDCTEEVEPQRAICHDCKHAAPPPPPGHEWEGRSPEPGEKCENCAQRCYELEEGGECC